MTGTLNSPDLGLRAWLVVGLLGHAVALLALTQSSWIMAAFALGLGQAALVVLLRRWRGPVPSPVFVDTESKPYSSATRFDRRASRVRADSWLLAEQLVAGRAAGDADPSLRGARRFGILSPRSVVPLERFDTLEEAEAALAGVRRQAPKLAARLRVTSLEPERAVSPQPPGDGLGHTPSLN